MTITVSTESIKTTLTQEEITRYLLLYKPEHIYLIHAEYEDGQLSTIFRNYPLEFHREPLKHLSRVQIVHFIGQAAYTLGGCLAKEGRLAPLDRESYIDRVQTERATFCKLQLEFKQFLPNADETKLQIRCTDIKKSNRFLIVFLDFELGDKACMGKAEAIIFL